MSCTTRKSLFAVAPVTLAILIAVVLTFQSGAKAGPAVFVGTRSPAARVSMDQIDHSAWDAILRRYVNDDGMVNYRSLRASADVRALDAYLVTLSTADPTIPASRDATLAFWINAYNAVTVRGILREYPTSSIRNHTAKLVGYNIWKDLQLYVGGTSYSLDSMEHEILRPMGDPRIHFAIVCASVGCPRLLNEAYVAARIDNQLEENSRDFFSRSQNFQHDERGHRFNLSSILNWFGEDFGPDQAAQLQYISQWLPSSSARQAALSNDVRVSYLEYDWSLNAQ